MYFVSFLDKPNDVRLNTNTTNKVCAGITVNFTCSADVNPAVHTYLLYKNNTAIYNMALGTVTETMDSAGQYVFRCEANNSVEGTERSSDHLLTVHGELAKLVNMGMLLSMSQVSVVFFFPQLEPSSNIVTVHGNLGLLFCNTLETGTVLMFDMFRTWGLLLTVHQRSCSVTVWNLYHIFVSNCVFVGPSLNSVKHVKPTIRFFHRSHNTVHFGGGICIKTMDNQFTEARYSPKSKQLVLFLCKEPPKTCCIMGS